MFVFCSPSISPRINTPQSEEDLQLKNELEMLVERLRVCYATIRQVHGD